MEILLVLALIIAAGSGKNVPPPQQLLETLSALSPMLDGAKRKKLAFVIGRLKKM